MQGVDRAPFIPPARNANSLRLSGIAKKPDSVGDARYVILKSMARPSPQLGTPCRAGRSNRAAGDPTP